MKTLKLTLGGKERTLLFQTMGFYQYIKEQAKKDPFEWLKEFDKKREPAEDGSSSYIFDTAEDLYLMIYAGINCYNDSQDAENIPFDKVRKWCNALENDKYADVIIAAFVTDKPETPGEAPAPASGA